MPGDFLVSIDVDDLQDTSDDKNDRDETNENSSDDGDIEELGIAKELLPPEKKLKLESPFNSDKKKGKCYAAAESTKVRTIPLMPYRCTLCTFTTGEMEALNEHTNIIHRDETVFNCSHCSHEDFYQEMVRHYASAHNTKEYQELIRCQTLINEVGISEKYIRNGRYECRQCDFHHIKFVKLKFHMKDEHNESPYYCSLCPFNACDIAALRSHLTSFHKKVEPFKCLLCDYSSDKFRNVQLHANSRHNLIKPLGCSLCPFKTGMGLELRKHLRTHMVHETFQCFLCAECFEDTRGMLDHFNKIHSKKGLYKCPQCPLSYFVFKNLADHEAAMHNVSKPFCCTLCDFSSSTIKSFSKHSESLHQKYDLKEIIKFDENTSKVFIDTLEKFVEQKTQLNKQKRTKNIKLRRPRVLSKPVTPSSPIKKEKYVCHLCDFKSTYVTMLRNHITFVHVKGSVKTEVDYEKDISESNDQMNISCPVVKTEIQEESDSSQRKSKRRVSAPIKYQTDNKCDYCNFVAKTGDLLSKHVSVFHKRKARFTPSPVKITCEPVIDEQILVKPSPKPTITGIKRGRPKKKIETANYDNEETRSNEVETNNGEDDFLTRLYKGDLNYTSVEDTFAAEVKKEIIAPSQTRKCLLCEFETERADHLIVHLMNQHLEVIGKKNCYHCKMEFEDIERLRFHVAVAHDNPDTLLCGFCGLSIPTPHLLEAHIHYKHKTMCVYPCIHCNKECRSLKLFRDHMEKEHMDGAETALQLLFPCALCPFATDSSIMFNKHVTQVHPDSKIFLCKFCDYSNLEFSALKRHLFSVHHKIKEFQCPFCTYFCARKGQLKQHALRKHKEWAKTL